MPRPIWSGAISFGLVTVPVKLYPAVQPKGVSFHQVDEASGSRIKYKRVSEKTGRDVPYERIKKGYEVDDGSYVVIDPKELEKFAPEATRRIDITDFVDLDEIDPIYYEHTYFLAPDKGGDKAYSLLLKAMEDGIGDKELKMARQLIDSLADEFDPDKYEDTYRKHVLDFIKKKAKGKTIEIEHREEEKPAVADLMDALRKSVEGSSKSGRKRASGSRNGRRRVSTHRRSA